MNPTLEWFLLTEHLVFLVPTTAALTLGILELASGGLSQAIGLDTDLDVDTDVDIDADLDGDLDLQSGSGGLFLTPLSWLGFGRAQEVKRSRGAWQHSCCGLSVGAL